MCVGLLCKLIAYILTGLGLVAIIIGAVLGFAVLPNQIDDEIETRVRLEEGSSQFERWENVAFDQQIKVYFFQIQNPAAASGPTGARPEVLERGPFVYRQNRQRQVIRGNEGRDTLRYTESFNFIFDSVASGTLNQNEQIVIFNAPLVGTLQALESLYNPMPNVDTQIPLAFPESGNLFQSFNVHNFLFDGFQFCPNPSLAPNMCMGNISLIDYLHREDNGAITFAFLRRRNNMQGTYVISTGMDRIQDLGLIREWNDRSTLPEVWGTTGNCQNIRGGDGTIYPPFIQRNTDLPVFYSDICRTISLDHVNNEDFEDIPAHRREFHTSTLTNTGANDCFCSRFTRTPDGLHSCWPNGFLDIGTCTGGHVVLSYPHFLGAANFQDSVAGLNPEEDLHGSYIILEPGTGTPLKIVRRFQYNMVLRPLPGASITASVSPAVVPILWIEESMELPRDLMQKIRDEYLHQLHIVTIITWVLIGGGIVMIVASILLRFICC